MGEEQNIPEDVNGQLSMVNKEHVPSNEHAENEELSTINQQPSTEMEVHHHPEVEKKGFKEYLLEGLMIFVAVMLGFIAENIREGIADNEKGEEYVASLVQNLKDDTANITIAIAENTAKLEGLNKLMVLGQKDLSADATRNDLYIACSSTIGRYSIFKSNDATMQQLKNSGGLRYIKKAHVADSIARYITETEFMYAAGDLYLTATNGAILASHELLDYSIYYDSSYFFNGKFTGKPLPLLATDLSKQKQFFNKIDFEIGATKNYIYNLSLRKPFIISLLNYLKSKYHLDNE